MQGKKNSKKIAILTRKVEGATSANACKTYNKKDRTKAKTIATCIEEGKLQGNAGKFYLVAFFEGDTNSFINAAKTLIDRTRDDRSPQSILNAVPEFREQASAKQLSRFGALLKTKGHSASDCK